MADNQSTQLGSNREAYRTLGHISMLRSKREHMNCRAVSRIADDETASQFVAVSGSSSSNRRVTMSQRRRERKRITQVHEMKDGESIRPARTKSQARRHTLVLSSFDSDDGKSERRN